MSGPLRALGRAFWPRPVEAKKPPPAPPTIEDARSAVREMSAAWAMAICERRQCDHVEMRDLRDRMFQVGVEALEEAMRSSLRRLGWRVSDLSGFEGLALFDHDPARVAGYVAHAERVMRSRSASLLSPSAS